MKSIFVSRMVTALWAVSGAFALEYNLSSRHSVYAMILPICVMLACLVFKIMVEPEKPNTTQEKMTKADLRLLLCRADSFNDVLRDKLREREMEIASLNNDLEEVRLRNADILARFEDLKRVAEGAHRVKILTLAADLCRSINAGNMVDHETIDRLMQLRRSLQDISGATIDNIRPIRDAFNCGDIRI